ncbi:2-dehydropantoate 2-reductase [Bacillus seohaeanensis]|jgi:2-dehydropantoate 2-reductase|uniref:2-dehydropantoate 2-reductase n=1 Tax=Bacillus seohaeanensis TaxID=284580 RepID=A0ABW5RW33_9BACI
MKIGIIGGGAIGLLFASYLGRNHNVVCQTKTAEQANLLKERPIELIVKKDCVKTEVEGCQDLSKARNVDLVIVAVKQYHLNSIKNTLLQISQNTPLLFLQNGLAHLTFIEALPHRHIFVGTVEHGAVKSGNISVSHNGIGSTSVAVVKGNEQKLDYLFKDSIPLFPFRLEVEYKTMILKKLFVNVLINPLTAITNVKNGRIIENPFFQEVQIQLFEELMYLFPEMNGKIEIDDVKSVCQNTSDNYSSMFKDFEAERTSELETIVGVLISKAQKEDKRIPSIHLLYQLLKGKEWEYLGLNGEL